MSRVQDIIGSSDGYVREPGSARARRNSARAVIEPVPLSWEPIQSASFTAEIGKGYPVNTGTMPGITMTLPANPAHDAEVGVYIDQASGGNLTVARDAATSHRIGRSGGATSESFNQLGAVRIYQFDSTRSNGVWVWKTKHSG